MSKMSSEEEEAVQAELEALQREALVRRLTLYERSHSPQPSVPVEEEPVSLPSVPIEEPAAPVEEGKSVQASRCAADHRTGRRRFKTGASCYGGLGRILSLEIRPGHLESVVPQRNCCTYLCILPLHRNSLRDDADRLCLSIAQTLGLLHSSLLFGRTLLLDLTPASTCRAHDYCFRAMSASTCSLTPFSHSSQNTEATQVSLEGQSSRSPFLPAVVREH